MACISAAVGVTLLRLNGECWPQCYWQAAELANTFSDCIYQARSISAAQRGAMEMVYNIPTSCYRCARVCACQTL